jgi:hypothetical protein
MASLSRYHAIAPRALIVPDEVDATLQRFFGRPAKVQKPQVFGYGVCHAVFSEPLPDPLGSAWLQEWVGRVRSYPPESAERERLEFALISGPTPEEEATLRGYAPLAAKLQGEQWARGREDTRAARKEQGWLRGERSERLAQAETLVGEKVIWERAGVAGVTPEEILALGREGMTQLIKETPVIDVTCELGRLRDVADSRLFSSNDLADVSFLGPAIVYCDIVVTERQWVDFAKRAGLEEKYQTKMLHDLPDLVPLLV